jgi:hypothetical protein
MCYVVDIKVSAVYEQVPAHELSALPRTTVFEKQKQQQQSDNFYGIIAVAITL